MSTVNKTDIEYLFAELFEVSLLVLAVIPDEAEISANNKGITLFEFFQCRRIKAAHIAVHITGYIYHILL